MDKPFSATMSDEIFAELQTKRAKRRKKPEAKPNGADAVSIDTFHAFLPQHAYIYIPTGDLWPATSVDAVVSKVGRLKASAWLDENKAVQAMTWAPGEPKIIRNKLVAGGGWKEHEGAAVYNLYVPPPSNGGDPAKAQRWIDHVDFVYPETSGAIIRWCAQRVQEPRIKINHAIVLGGPPQVGKDTLLEPVRRAVGYWNTKTVDPPTLLGRFNGFLKSVILCISEARDLGDINRFQLYEHLKPILAAPPDTIEIDEKNLGEYSIPNLVGVVITTNHKDGLFLPPDDRRYLVNWSPRSQGDFAESYWNEFWRWYEDGGFDHVAAYLRDLDISEFNPKAPPPKTRAFWEFVDAGRAPENSEIADLLDDMGRPDATYPAQLVLHAQGDLIAWLNDRKNRKLLPRRLADCGYVAVPNDNAADRLWKINGKRQVVYAPVERTRARGSPPRKPYERSVRSMKSVFSYPHPIFSISSCRKEARAWEVFMGGDRKTLISLTTLTWLTGEGGRP